MARESLNMADDGENVAAIDEIDCLVQEIWLESPGIGNKALREQVQQRSTTTDVTRQRIKRVKALLPYRCISSQKHTQHDFVVRKLQERQSLRIERRFEQADRIHRGLEAMGIVIDDALKTWTIGESKQSTENDLVSDDSGVQCEMCSRYFASRNLVFKHLRDPASGCGTSIFASGQELKEAPSVMQKKRQRQQKSVPSAPGKTARHAPALHCVWLGDLPISWTRRQKRLRAILFQHLPPTIQEPWIKTVVRKAYRSGETNEYLGFAIVVFRDEQEAATAREALNGKTVTAETTFQTKNDGELDHLPMFVLKARPVEKDDSASAETAWKTRTGEGAGGRDPPLEEQLRPLDLNELVRRIGQIEDNPRHLQLSLADNEEGLYRQRHQEALKKLVSILSPRQQVRLQGRPIPKHLCNKLLEILQDLCWPARNERPRLTSERYLVLPTNITNDRFYTDLRQACRKLMDWADPLFYYSGIAVTKNFVASPHIDVKDQNYQYAASLGDFDGGGELCVEGNDGDSVNVVDTHNRIARVDGRHVHWVRTWEQGDRYSLIFYDTSDRKKTKASSNED